MQCVMDKMGKKVYHVDDVITSDDEIDKLSN